MRLTSPIGFGNQALHHATWPLTRSLGLVLLGLLLAALLAALPPRAHADEDFLVHGQLTYSEQETDGFHSPYAGANSLLPAKGAETVDATLSLGWLLAPRTELWLAPELDQGFGLSNSLGLAGFASGEAYKVGHKRPALRSTRMLLRWNSAGSGDAQEQSDGLASFKQSVSAHRWEITLGKFSVVDVFDNSQYAHDPRNDFLNWSVMDSGTFDYAADAYGYSVGMSIERIDGDVTQRVGVFDLSNIPNSPHLTAGLKQFEVLAESEWRFDTSDNPGRLWVTGFMNRAHMAKLADLLNPMTQVVADPASARQLHDRFGISAGLEKAVNPNLAVFVKAGHADGRFEVYEFTEIDRTLALGLTGTALFPARAADHWGLSVVRNQISAERIAYLQQGGLGILIGDGRLPHPGPEQLAEAFYNVAVGAHWFVTGDVQYVVNPAYNRDRGPVTLWAVRVHGQF